MRWGMPPPPKLGGPPVTNIRSSSPPSWLVEALLPSFRRAMPINASAYILWPHEPGI